MPPSRADLQLDSCEPSNVLLRLLVVNGRTFASTLSYSSRESDDPIHLLRLSQVRCVDEHRVLRLNGLRRIARIPMHDPIGLLGDLRIGRPTLHLLGKPPPRTLPRIGDQKNLERRVRKYSRAHVATVHNDVVPRGGVANQGVDPFPDAWHLRDQR